VVAAAAGCVATARQEGVGPRDWSCREHPKTGPNLSTRPTSRSGMSSKWSRDKVLRHGIAIRLIFSALLSRVRAVLPGTVLGPKQEVLSDLPRSLK
jgi:hypothetical protein